MSVLEQEVTSEDLLGSGRAVLPRVNLLPPEILVRRFVRRVQYGLAGAGLTSVALLGLLYVGAVNDAKDADAELREATAAGQAAQAEQAKYADVNAVYARADAAEVMLTQAMGEEVRYSSHLQQLARTVPDQVWLKNVAFTQTPPAPAPGDTTPGIGSVTFTGVGYEHDDVATWLETLATHKGYAKPYLTSSTEALIGKRVTVDFVTTVVMTPDSLSRRYTAPAGG
jgi:Tfp pilus assembly protein PilN